MNVNHPFFHLALRLRKNWLPTITNSGIHNLSTKGTSTKSISSLSLGLNFIPVPRLSQSPTSYLLTQWIDFRRRVNIKYFFSVHPTTTSLNQYRLKSSWEPTADDFKPYTYCSAVSEYLNQVKNNLLSASASASSTLSTSFASMKEHYQNPSWLISSLCDLRNNQEIIVTEADKNMGIVLIDKTSYIAEGSRQLQCSRTYNKHCIVDNMLFRKLYAQLRLVLNKHDQLFATSFYSNKNELSPLAKFLLELEQHHQQNFEAHAAKFYLLLKMHKTPVAGRPIVSTVNSFTYNVSRYVDGELKCLLPLIPSYIESSQQLIHTLETLPFSPSCVICCADIESLYPNIPIEEGLLFVKKSILRLRDRLKYQSPLRNDTHLDMIMQLMTWVLKNNYFKFGNQWYLQLQGTAMGTPLAVPFACLFVAHIEYLIWSQSNVLKPALLYRRYIDDIFYMAQSREDAELFFEKFNNVLPTIRCGSITIDNHSGIFLDIEIYKGKRFQLENILDFRTYQKVQNRYLYLAPNSFHRRDIFKSTIVSELNRYRLTCNDDNDFYRMRSLFYQRLRARGYNSEYLNLIFPCHSSRSELLQNIHERFINNGANKSDQDPLLFKVINASELSAMRISQLTRVPDSVREHADKHALALLSHPIISCYSNGSSSYKYIGNARKTLNQK